MVANCQLNIHNTPCCTTILTLETPRVDIPTAQSGSFNTRTRTRIGLGSAMTGFGHVTIIRAFSY